MSDQRVAGSAGRRTGTATPVDVSLCAQAIDVTDGSATRLRGAARVGLDRRSGRRGTGLLATRGGELRAELAVGQVQRALRRPGPKAAASQNAVVPPLPSTTSYPSGSENSSRSPARTRPTRSLTGACRCEVPNSAAPVVASAC